MGRWKRLSSKRLAATTLLLFAGSLASSTGCELIATVDRSQINNGGSGGEGVGGTGGTGGVACTPEDDMSDCTVDTCNPDGTTAHTPEAEGTMCSTNGGSKCDANGACVQCFDATECPGTDDFCQQRTCDAGVCGVQFTAVDTALPMQDAGDCQQVVCDGAGMTKSNIDDTDIPEDNEACTTDACDMGVPSNTNLAQGDDCSASGTGLVCNDMGQCVGCNTEADCPGTNDECKTRTCNMNVCGFDYTAKDTAVADQTANNCLLHVCDGAGNFVDIEDATDTPLDDGNACTGETCVGGMPMHPNVTNGNTCEDGNLCSGIDTCQDGVCTVGTATVCTASDECHEPGTCNPTDGKCDKPVAMNGKTCSDGNPCTQSDICTDGECGGTAVVCNTPGTCQDPVGSCNTMNGECVYPPSANGTSCNDNDNCTLDDKCSGLMCAGTAVVCNTPGTCQDANGSCNAMTGTCNYPTSANGTMCTSNMTAGTCNVNGECIACGDGIVTMGEGCDDGNLNPGDGCNASCAVEANYNCAGSPSVCAPICGDNLIIGTETCDDGNTTPGDGCSNTCQIEITCGAGEQKVVVRNTTALPIPDGNALGAQSPVNVTATGGVTKAVVVVHSLTHTFLNDVDMFLVSPQNRSRDVSTDNGGSSTLGYVKTTFDDAATTLISAVAATPPYSGVFKPEQSLSTTAGTDFTGLNANGTWNLHVFDDFGSDIGTLNSWSLALCVNPASYCGDSTVTAGEQCDDGNTNDADACNNLCQFNCGDGLFDVGEQCDDGNNASGDGCSSSCQVEITCGAGQTPVILTNSTSAGITNDNVFNNFPVNVATAGGVKKVVAVIGNIFHTANPELDIQLQSPAGTVRFLSNDRGTTGGYWSTFFDDAAATAITAGVTPFRGFFRPEQTISTTTFTDFLNQNAVGTWNLQVRDDTSANANTGTFNSWTLAMCLDTVTYCGNSTVDANEECDDGNTNNADACSNTCQLNDGCGDGNWDAGEQCDDNNIASGDGCSATCTVEITCGAGQTPVIVTNSTTTAIPDTNTFIDLPVNVGTAGGVKKVVAVIGNIIHTNDADLDIQLQGPSGTVRNLSSDLGGTGDNYVSTFFDDAAAIAIASGAPPFSGRFRPQATISTTAGTDFTGQNAIGTWNLQVRDDLATNTGTFNSWTLAMCIDTATYCGDSKVDPGEECDDGNTNNADTCSNSCQLNDGCGDGNMDAGELCDDNNVTSGDGCSSTCQPDISCGVGEVPVIVTDNAMVAIPEDITGVRRPVNIMQTGVVRKVLATIDVTHANTGHVDVFLNSPFGVERELTTDNGTGANFKVTTFSDAAVPLITSGTAPFTGTFKPEQTLSDAAGFGAQVAAGNWNLRIADDTTGTTGTLNSWTLALCIDPTVTDTCGNGIIEGSEVCDDGNLVSGDGCAACQLEITCGMGQTLVVQKSADGPFAIPDNNTTGVTSVINIGSTGTVAKAVVILNSISHTFDSDLDISLISPMATSVELSTDNGSSGDNYISTILDDSATPLITAGVAPMRGRFKPEFALSGVNGQNVNGNWSLKVADDLGGDVGVLNAWTLALCVTP